MKGGGGEASGRATGNQSRPHMYTAAHMIIKLLGYLKRSARVSVSGVRLISMLTPTLYRVSYHSDRKYNQHSDTDKNIKCTLYSRRERNAHVCFIQYYLSADRTETSIPFLDENVVSV